jgi:phosphatidylglycerophosphate synthase
MSVYRAVVGRHGVSIPARTTAKVKTLLQDVAIGLCLAPPLATHQGVLSAAIWAATVMTVFTGGQYYLDGRRAARGRATDIAGTSLGPVDGTSSAA